MKTTFRFLLLGYSKIAERRVLPAVKNLPGIGLCAVASRSRHKILCKDEPDLLCFSDYHEALKEFSPDIVYVSLANADHAQWVRKSLNAGAHVIVDKPAFQTLAEATELVNLSRSRGLILAEALVYAVHPQISRVKRCFSEAGSKISHISCHFTFPPLDSLNFRYSSSLGGGALMDLGPYATSVGRVFFESPPTNIFCHTSKPSNNIEVEIAFTMMATYPKGETVSGRFDFNGEYTNQITAIGSGLSVHLERFFTNPADLENLIHYQCKNKLDTLTVPKADVFQIFIERFINAVRCKDYEYYSSNLLADAQTREQLIVSSSDQE
jgi:predicted dehydrogenase